MKRKIVMDTGAMYRLGNVEKVLQVIKEAGFKCYDISLFWKDVIEQLGTDDLSSTRAKKLREYADSLGLTCDQAHGYFTTGIDKDAMDRRYKYSVMDIENASILGAKIIVFHPIIEFSFEQNIEFFKYLLEYAHKFNIKIAIENCFICEDGKYKPMVSSTPEGLIKLIDTLNDPYVCACLDIGHAELEGLGTSAIEMIQKLGNRLQALHIHDNNKTSDWHQVPYTNFIDFDAILKCLKENNYQGNITFEIEHTYSRIPLPLYPAFAKLEYELGKYFLSILDGNPND